MAAVPADVLARTPDHAKAGLQALHDRGYVPTKLSGVDPSDILSLYLQDDESTATIAQRYGVHRSAILQFLLRAIPDDWREAQAVRALVALENAKDKLESAADALSLARAREQLRSAQWELERLLSRLYGQKQEVMASVGVTVIIQRADAPQQIAPEVGYAQVVESDSTQ